MTKKRPPARAPRPQDLPGVDNRTLADLEQVALDYAEIRDRRMVLTQDEARLKQQAIALLKKHHKTSYRREGLELAIVPGEDGLRVRVKRDADATEADDAGAGEPREVVQ